MVDGVEAVDGGYAPKLEAEQQRAVVCAGVADILPHKHEFRPIVDKAQV